MIDKSLSLSGYRVLLLTDKLAVLTIVGLGLRRIDSPFSGDGCATGAVLVFHFGLLFLELKRVPSRLNGVSGAIGSSIGFSPSTPGCGSGVILACIIVL